MSIQTLTTKRSEAGFTLVELAIVMVIIGLLIAGLLKGQELIANARVTSTVSQIKSLDAAMNTFEDKYNAIPGDMNNVPARLTGGLAAENGDGNGVIGAAAGVAAALNEGTYVFAQLSRADLISGIDISRGLAVGGLNPVVPVGGTMWLGTSTAAGGATGLGAATLGASRLYASLNGSLAVVGGLGASGSIPVVAAAQIDRKLDDGISNTGSVQSSCAAAAIGAGGIYNESATTSCSMFARVLN